MSWRIWISQDTRVKQKVISASFAYLNLVESKLNCQNRDYLPLGILLRVLMTIVWYHGEFTDRIFYWSPTWTKTSEFEQSVEVRTDAKSESGIVEGFPSMNISPSRDPYTVFTSFLVSRLVSCYYSVLTLHSTTLRRIQDHIFKNRPLDPPCGSKFILVSILLNSAPTRLSCRFWDSGAALIWYTSLPRTVLFSTQRGSYCFCLLTEMLWQRI